MLCKSWLIIHLSFESKEIFDKHFKYSPKTNMNLTFLYFLLPRVGVMGGSGLVLDNSGGSTACTLIPLGPGSVTEM